MTTLWVETRVKFLNGNRSWQMVNDFQALVCLTNGISVCQKHEKRNIRKMCIVIRYDKIMETKQDQVCLFKSITVLESLFKILTETNKFVCWSYNGIFYQWWIFYSGRKNASVDFVYSYLRFIRNKILTIILLYSTTQRKRWEILFYVNPSRIQWTGEYKYF